MTTIASGSECEAADKDCALLQDPCENLAPAGAVADLSGKSPPSTAVKNKFRSSILNSLRTGKLEQVVSDLEQDNTGADAQEANPQSAS